jgi:hypothetical protein
MAINDVFLVPKPVEAFSLNTVHSATGNALCFEKKTSIGVGDGSFNPGGARQNSKAYRHVVDFIALSECHFPGNGQVIKFQKSTIMVSKF